MGKHSLEIPQQLNLASYFLEENIEKGRGNRVAIYYRDEAYSYYDLVKMVNKIGNILKGFGVEHEDRVLLILRDSPEWVASWHGTMKIGGVSTCAYTYLNVGEYEYFINYIKPKVIIADDSTIEKVKEAIKNLRDPRYLKAVLVSSDTQINYKNNVYCLNTLMEEADNYLEPENTSKDDLAFWNFSGGTTGKPKGVPHMHHVGVIGYESLMQVIPYNENDLVLNVPKLFFHYAHDLGLNFTLRSGGSIILYPERTTPKLIFKLIEKYKPTILVNVPTMMRAMLQTKEEERCDLSCLRAILSSGEALSAELYKNWMNTFGVDVVELVGSAESYLGFISNRPGEKIPGSAGKISPFVEAKLVDNEGNIVPKGEPGTLLIKSDAIGTHYHLDHEKSKKVFLGNDWLNTGDEFKEDSENNLWYIGRGGESIKISGVWVSLLEIEQRLSVHPNIKECVVLGVKDEFGLLTAKAYIVLNEGLKPSDSLVEEFKTFCKEKLAGHKYPRVIEFLNELPKTGQGKIDKRKLKEKEIS